jgi:transcriptional regulator with XRE-family HTH domain
MKHYRPSLDRLAQLAQQRPNLLAGPLHLYKEQEGLDDEQLATMLGCELEALSRLALCERPRPTPHFREDVERIAAYIHADMLQLAMLIRAAESREALSHRPGTARPTLLAARDHNEHEEMEEMEEMEKPQTPDSVADEDELSDGSSR